MNTNQYKKEFWSTMLQRYKVKSLEDLEKWVIKYGCILFGYSSDKERDSYYSIIDKSNKIKAEGMGGSGRFKIIQI